METNETSPLENAVALHMSGEFESAEKEYRALLNGKSSAVLHNNLAFLLFQRGAYQESVTHYRSSIETDPGYSTAYTNYGQLLLRIGQYEEAFAILKKAIELDPSDFLASRAFAKYYLLTENFAQAEDWLKQSCEMRKDEELLLDLSWCQLMQGKLQEAAAMLVYCESIGIATARYHQIWGLLHFAGNNFGQATHCFRQSLGLEPENIESRNNLVACLLKAGNTEAAMHEMRRILMIEPDHIESLNNIAVLQLALNNTKEAHTYLDQALAIDPVNGKGLFYKAMLYVQEQNRNEAVGLLKELGSSDSNGYSEKAREALALLEQDRAV